ncbi:MAG: anti-sigma factor antagonist [Clostridia bacterium]|nr:anti-sigma factor antagonist [Clostridia bacterium]
MKEDVTFSYSGGNLTARICCELDHHTVRRIREKTDSRLFRDKPERLTLDFSGVGFMDSSGIGLILGRVETASAVGATVCITGASPMLMKLLRLSGIERIRNLTVMR